MFVGPGVRIQCEGGEKAIPDTSLVDEIRNTKRTLRLLCCAMPVPRHERDASVLANLAQQGL
jgi:hypothetical protein